MAKDIKGNRRRRAPLPADGCSEIDDWFERVWPALQPIVRAVDAAIRSALPGVDYAVKYNRAFYGLPGLGWVIEVAPYYKSVNVLFLGGSDFAAPPSLGTTGRTRYVKIATEAEATKPTMAEWIKQAASVPGWK